MLRLVNKERFESFCLGRKPDYTIRNNLNHFNKFITSYTIEWPYYEIPEKNIWILFLNFMNLILVFGKESLEDPDDFKINFDDWNLIKISDESDKQYILNIMKAYNNLDYDFYKVCDTGSWKLRNDRIGVNIDFSCKISGTDYYRNSSIGFPEKLEMPVNLDKIKIKTQFIETLCYGIRGNDNEDSIGSK